MVVETPRTVVAGGKGGRPWWRWPAFVLADQEQTWATLTEAVCDRLARTPGGRVVKPAGIPGSSGHLPSDGQGESAKAAQSWWLVGDDHTEDAAKLAPLREQIVVLGGGRSACRGLEVETRERDTVGPAACA